MRHPPRLYDGGDPASIFTSDFWTDTFGLTDGVTHRISTGRFANQTVGVANMSDPSATHSAYGYARAPWNLNPSRYVP